MTDIDPDFKNEEHLVGVEEYQQEAGRPKVKLAKFLSTFERELSLINSGEFSDVGKILDMKDSRHIEEMLPPKSDETYYYAPLMEHELINTVGGVISWLALWKNDGEEDKRKNIENKRIVEKMQAGVNFMKILADGIKKEGKLDRLDIYDLLSTIPSDNFKWVKPLSEVKFDNLEQFLSVRTLIDNSLKEKKVYQVFVDSRIAEDGSTEYFVIDDAPSLDIEKGETYGDWSNYSKDSTVDMYLSGQHHPDLKYPSPQGGMSIVAYRAGQRHDEFELGAIAYNRELVESYPELSFDMKFARVKFRNRESERD